MKHNIVGFKDYCEQRTKLLAKLIREDVKLYAVWLDEMCKVYHCLYSKEVNNKRIENSSVVSLWMEMIDTLDGVCVLHRNNSISTANVLIRKLIEIDAQLKYILIDDFENKALAYEAYYVSRAAEGKDAKNNIFQQYERYNLYKKEADKAFVKEDDGNVDSKRKKGVFNYWFTIYDNVERQCGNLKRNNMNKLGSINALMQEVAKLTTKEGEAKNAFDVITQKYNYLSQDTHGFRTRKYIKLNMGENYIECFHNPFELKNQVEICQNALCDSYKALCSHYDIEYDGVLESIEVIFKKTKDAYAEWERNESDKWFSFNRRLIKAKATETWTK